MSTRRSGQENRCPKCRVNFNICYCSKIKTLALKTKISIIMHKKERALTSNTAHLTLNSIENSKLFIRGIKDVELDPSFLEQENFYPMYLYPSDDAQELTPQLIQKLDKPIHLIIPDGTWRQASKFHKRDPLLKEIPKVRINITTPSQYYLRKQKFEYGLCTHEAIAYALSIIENEEVCNALLSNLKEMVNANLEARNKPRV